MGFAALFACALALGGCGGVQFEGKVFDYMGVSGDRQEPDVRMSERPPLLIPPNTKALPPPGSGVAAVTARQDWPDDPERVKKRIATAKKEEQAKQEAELDPLNPMAGKPTLLDKWFGSSEDEEVPVADVPEPDPSDRLPGEDTGVAEAKQPPLTPHVPHTPVQPKPEESTAPSSYSDPTARRALY